MDKAARIAELDAVIRQFDLNTHPFYEEWRMGTLLTQKLADYSTEYGEFVKTIGLGWDQLGQEAYVQEEAEHVNLWADFRNELQPEGMPEHPQTTMMVTTAKSMFATKPGAIGALYAFEAQQPATAKSKLNGLKEHYALSEKAQEYFVVHARQHSEYEDLQGMIAELTDAEFAQAKTACTAMCVGMWAGLDGVYYQG